MKNVFYAAALCFAVAMIPTHASAQWRGMGGYSGGRTMGYGYAAPMQRYARPMYGYGYHQEGQHRSFGYRQNYGMHRSYGGGMYRH